MNGIRKSASILSVLLLVALKSLSQQEIQNSFYMFNSSVLNPAYAGSRDALSIVMDYRSQWTGWKGAPNTGNLIAHTPLMNESIGVGLNVLNDRIGSTQRNTIFGDFAYRLRLNKANDRLCFGLRAGVDLLKNDFASLAANDVNDPISLNNLNFNSTSFNTGFGVYYYGKRHYLGLTAPKILPANISKDASFTSSKLVPHYYLIAGYVFKLNSLWDLKPGLCVKYTQNAPLSVDGNISVLFNEMIWFGLMYRNGSAAGVNVMYHVSKQLRIGYAYDYSLTNMGNYNPSTHEVLIGYEFLHRNKSFRSPRYF